MDALPWFDIAWKIGLGLLGCLVVAIIILGWKLGK